MKINKTIQIKNKISAIGEVMEMVESLGDELGISMKTVFDITLSLDELLTNVISYAFTDQKEHKIIIDFTIDEDCFKIDIMDDGKSFNPLDQDNPDFDLDIDDMEIGGLGIHLVKSKIDELVYERKDNKNILKLKKIIRE